VEFTGKTISVWLAGEMVDVGLYHKFVNGCDHVRAHPGSQ
jgi:hypothetical protein